MIIDFSEEIFVKSNLTLSQKDMQAMVRVVPFELKLGHLSSPQHVAL